MPRSKNGLTLEDLKKKVLAKAIRTPKTAAELAERVNLPGYDGRALARAIGALVNEGKLEKTAGRKPTYSKVS